MDENIRCTVVKAMKIPVPSDKSVSNKGKVLLKAKIIKITTAINEPRPIVEISCFAESAACCAQNIAPVLDRFKLK